MNEQDLHAVSNQIEYLNRRQIVQFTNTHQYGTANNIEAIASTIEVP